MILIFSFFIFWSQKDFQGWESLEKLELIKTYDEFLGEDMEMPRFEEELIAFDGDEVSLKGYVIPLETSGATDFFVLSRFPYNSCFFCGNAGPETVAEVYSEEKFSYRDQRVEVHGILKLNSEDPLHLFFIIEKAEVEVLE